MSQPIQYIFDSVGKIIAQLAGITEAEAEGSPILDPITGFLALFAGLDLGGLITDLGSSVIELLSPQNRTFYLGLTAIVPTTPTVTLPVPPAARPVPVPFVAPTPTIEPRIEPEPPTKPTYLTPEEILAKRKTATTTTPTKTTTTREPLTESKSIMVVNEEAVISAMNQVTLFHSAMVIVMSIVSVIVETGTLGQIDKILESLQSCYALLDTSGQFFAAQGARIDIAFERPYRYWLESQLLNNVPPPADLGRFLARETLSPEDYTGTMRYWGFGDFWSDIYKRSRYIELPAETIFKAYHYGEIDDDEKLRLLKIADYNPQQVPLLSRLAMDYPNRTELRLMARRSSIPRELVASALDTSGLRPEYQPYLIETLDNWNVDRTHNASITEAIGQFERGFVDLDRLMQILVENEASEGEAIKYQSLAILRREGRRKQERTKTIRLAFRHGLLQPTAEYEVELATYMPDVLFEEATETDVYKALMIDIGFDLLDIELMLDDDRVKSKDIEVIESLGELLDLLRESE